MKIQLLILSFLFPFLAIEAKEVNSARKIIPLKNLSSISNHDPSDPNQVFEFYTKMEGYDANDQSWADDFMVTDLSNKIWLQINPYDGQIVDFGCKIKIEFEIEHSSFPEGNLTTETHSLEIDYNPNAHEKFKKVDFLELTGGQNVKVTIINIDYFGLSDTQIEILEELVFLNAETIDTRYYKIDTNNKIDCNDIYFSVDPGVLIVHWTNQEYAEEYDIDILFNDTYIGGTNSVNALNPFVGQTSLPEKDFYADATRISSLRNRVEIPIINEQGKYKVRIRPIGRKGSDFQFRFEYPWSCIKEHSINAHENDNINYQSIVTYAEESKYKVVNQYFDGRMASRQKVTSLQSNNYALVQESIPDAIGRNVIEVLPGPVKNGSIQFYRNFNQNLQGEPYNYTNFEKSDCNAAPDPMNNNSGTAYYYSESHFNSLSNIEKETELANIPKANGFPFTQTVFMNDNTARPIAQGGVGKHHHVGSGHETKIYYVDVAQEELNRLFGTEVGYAKHYKKVVTVDPNGQTSYAYQDLKGNTIATSLSGTIPEKLETLASYSPISIDTDLSKKRNIDDEEFTLLTSHEFYVDESKEYDFDYEIVSAAFSAMTCNLSSKCYDCIYDITLRLVKTDCNEVLEEIQNTLIPGNEINDFCEGSQWSYDFNKQLDSGQYAVEAIVSVNESYADQYMEEYFNDENNQCVTQLSEIENELLVEALKEPCEVDCDMIAQDITNLRAEINRIGSTINVNLIDEETRYQLENHVRILEAEIESLTFLCEKDVNKCENARRAMLMDFQPFGQYAQLELDENGVLLATDELSIFNTNNVLGDGTSSIDYKDFTFTYYDDNGQPIEIDPNDYDLSTFINHYWQPEWAEVLLEHHPEYCYLEACHIEGADYMAGLEGMEFAPASIQNNPSGASIFLEDDFFINNKSDLANIVGVSATNFDQLIKDRIQVNYLVNYTSGDQIALYDLAVQMLCMGNEFLADVQNQTPTQDVATCVNSVSLNPSNPFAAQLWATYLGLYKNIREQYEYLYNTEYAIANNCYNACIGVENFNHIRHGFSLGTTAISSNSQFSNPAQICNDDEYELYKDKFKHFPGPYDFPGMEDIDDIYDPANLEQIVEAAQNGAEEVINLMGCEVIQTQNDCIEYACLDELKPFFEQFIIAGDYTFYKPGNLEVPDCFGFSPFLNYETWNETYIIPAKTLLAQISTVGDQQRQCEIKMKFAFDEDFDYGSLSSTDIKEFIDDIKEFGTFTLDIDNLDVNGETNEFNTIAYSHLNGGVFPLKVKGSISCAKLGRCCIEDAEEILTDCKRIMDIDNPQNIEEELWIGNYFDPLWLKNPCENAGAYNNTEIVASDSEDIGLCGIPDTYPTFPIENNCEDAIKELVAYNAQVQHEQYIENEKAKLKSAYMKHCLSAVESFNMNYESGEHHFVLSYYDQAGNLSRTVPPNGTFDYNSNQDKTFYTAQQSATVNNARNNGTTYKPSYEAWDTRYTYNSLNQITTQNLPDHGSENALNQTPIRDGISKFYYDYLGRLVLSQSSQQIFDNKYSYTRYDNLGRIFQSGQLVHQNAIIQFEQDGIFQSLNPGEYAQQFISPPYGVTKDQITQTKYDVGTNKIFIKKRFKNNQQSNLRNRVAYASYFDTQQDLVNDIPSSASYYDYDELGNVKSLVQFMKNGYNKLIEYEYDLVSGNVNKVHYQRGEKDQFIHKYNYDADNRITEVHTSLDNCIWDKEAKYFFYPHGPLARTELGDEEVQGIDHIYTIQGWIKGVNSIALDSDRDPGNDGQASSMNSLFAPDEVGYMLNYFDEDYQSISGIQDFEPDYVGTAPGLYNGNIRNMSTSIGEIIRQNQNAYGYISNDYAYDQLNRIKEMRPFDSFDKNTNTWSSPIPSSNAWDNKAYYTNYTYDGNGNIFKLNRNGAASKPRMDKLTYKYARGNNQLTLVTDPVSSSNYPLDPSVPTAVHDFDSQVSYYNYDRNGNMIEDGGADMFVNWNVQGKVQSIIDTNGFPNSTGQTKNIEFRYDPLGNRIAKIIDNQATLYVRDAQGNLLSTYKKEMREEGTIVNINNPEQILWESAYIYGADRVGEYQANRLISGGKEASKPIVQIPNQPVIPNSQTGGQAGTILNPSKITSLLSDINFTLLTQIIPVGTNTSGPNPSIGPGISTSNQTQFKFKTNITNFHRAEKQYELTNHLGNVLATISDRKSTTDLNNDNTFVTDVTTATDYYPGGMIQPNRNYIHENTLIRFKHQGQESDDELAGRGMNYFYKYRMSDARLNRFWSVDPLYVKYPYYSTYQFSGNRLLDSKELEGLEEKRLSKLFKKNKLNSFNPNKRRFRKGRTRSQFHKQAVVGVTQKAPKETVERKIQRVDFSRNIKKDKKLIVTFNPLEIPDRIIITDNRTNRILINERFGSDDSSDSRDYKIGKRFTDINVTVLKNRREDTSAYDIGFDIPKYERVSKLKHYNGLLGRLGFGKTMSESIPLPVSENYKREKIKLKH